MNESLSTPQVGGMPEAALHVQTPDQRASLLSGNLPLFAEELFAQDHQQKVFRSLMEAFSRPGKILSVPGDHSALHSALLCLVDSQVTFADPCLLLATDMHRQLESHLTQPDQADYIEARGLDDPARCVRNPRIGTLDSPERSATVLLEVRDIRNTLSGDDIKEHTDSGSTVGTRPDSSRAGDQSHCLLLSGPGIPDRQVVQVTGLHAAWIRLREASNTGFPMGLDFILTAGSRFIAIPRTTRMTGEH